MSQQHVYFLTVGLILGTVLLVFGMKYFTAARQAQKDAASLAVMQADLAEIKTRLAAVEKILKTVE